MDRVFQLPIDHPRLALLAIAILVAAVAVLVAAVARARKKRRTAEAVLTALRSVPPRERKDTSVRIEEAVTRGTKRALEIHDGPADTAPRPDPARDLLITRGEEVLRDLENGIVDIGKLSNDAVRISIALDGGRALLADTVVEARSIAWGEPRHIAPEKSTAIMSPPVVADTSAAPGVEVTVAPRPTDPGGTTA